MTGDHRDPVFAYYRQLTGKTVDGVTSHPYADGKAYSLDFTDGTKALILCDEEGNGPGFLDITST